MQGTRRITNKDLIAAAAQKIIELEPCGIIDEISLLAKVQTKVRFNIRRDHFINNLRGGKFYLELFGEAGFQVSLSTMHPIERAHSQIFVLARTMDRLGMLEKRAAA